MNVNTEEVITEAKSWMLQYPDHTGADYHMRALILALTLQSDHDVALLAHVIVDRDKAQAALEASTSSTTTEWGVRLRTRDSAYINEIDARALATFFRNPLIKRTVSAWEVQA